MLYTAEVFIVYIPIDILPGKEKIRFVGNKFVKLKTQLLQLYTLVAMHKL
jgi:hypothetical protein